MDSPTSSSNTSPSLFPLLSNDELHYICELLSCDPISSPPHADDESTFFPLLHNVISPPSDHHLHSPPPSPLPPFSPHLPSDHALPPPSLVVGSPAKRDWLSSLSQLSPPSSFTSPAPTRRPLLSSSSSSSLSNSYSLIASSHSLSAPAPAHASSSATNLQNCKTLLKLRQHELHLNPGLSYIKYRQSEEASGKQCDGDNDSQAKPRAGSMLGANAYSVALRLSDVKAALQAMPNSHRSISATASLSSPAFTLCSSTAANPCTSTAASGTNHTIHSELLASCNINTSAEIPATADEWLRRSCSNGLLTRPNAESKRSESKKNKKKTDMLESVPSKVMKQDEVMQNTRKAHEIEELARRRESHIWNDRERRQGMKDLYRTLHSLLPGGKTAKVGRCSVVTGTMEYIQSLLKELDMLGKLKVEAIMSMEGRGNNAAKPDGESNVAHTVTKQNCNFVDTNVAKHAKEAAQTRTFVENCDSRDHGRKARGGAMAASGSDKEMKEGAGNGKRLVYKKKSNEKDDGGECIMMNGDESVVESHGTEVGVRFFGEDAFINVLTSKRRGAWSSLLEVLQQLDLYILNVTLSSSSNFNHHRIHAKVSSDCKLSSSDLQQRLRALVG